MVSSLPYGVDHGLPTALPQRSPDAFVTFFALSMREDLETSGILIFSSFGELIEFHASGFGLLVQFSRSEKPHAMAEKDACF